MGVNVNEARRNEFAHRVNSVFRLCVKELTDGSDFVANDPDIGEERRSPRPVNNPSIDDEPVKNLCGVQNAVCGHILSTFGKNFCSALCQNFVAALKSDFVGSERK